MAATHLTNVENLEVNLPDLIRRAASGEEILIETDAGPVLLTQPPTPAMDASVEATLGRLRRSAQERGGPLRMDDDFADDLEKIIAMRRPGRGDPWA